MTDIDPHAFYERMGRLAEQMWGVTEALATIAGLFEGTEQEEAERKEQLARLCKEMLLSILTALSNLGAKDMAAELSGVFKERINDGKLGDMYHRKDMDTLASRDLDLLWPYVQAIANQFDIDTGHYKRRELNELLQRVPDVIRLANVEPSRELDVDKAVLEFLRILFDGVLSNVKIPAEVKCYKPDAGIRGLRALIEYKFVDSADKLGGIIDQINADVPAYSDTRDWSWFYVVLYLTDKFLPPKDIFARFSAMPHNWQVIVVYHKGGSAVRRPTT
jgi:hypothetical protein